MIDKLRYWSHKILPLVYDDSLSYYEVLSKMRPELDISSNAVSIYCEVGYIYTRREVNVIVIDGIQEEL